MAERKIIEQPKIEQPSGGATLEKRPELSAGFSERVQPKIEKSEGAAKLPSPRPEPSAAILSTPTYQKQREVAIDNILAEGLNEIFLKMAPQDQAEFKKRGEETVAKINKLLDKTRVQFDKIISLIRKWLQLIPGVNKFFLEQEAKLKADKIMRLKDR